MAKKSKTTRKSTARAPTRAAKRSPVKKAKAASGKKAVKRTKAATAKTGGASSMNKKPKVAKVRKPTRVAARPPAATNNSRKRHLTKADIEHFRQMLLEKRAELAGDVNTLSDEALRRSRQDASGDLSTMPIHMADLGTDNYELELTLGLIEGERALLNEIDEALARVREGTYGLCLATGAPIGKARLKAKPWARYCYEYMLAQEKGQARRI